MYFKGLFVVIEAIRYEYGSFSKENPEKLSFFMVKS